MVKAYEAKTINKFGTLRVSGGTAENHGTYANADLEDNEATTLTNFVFNDTGGISKRHSISQRNTNVVPTITKPIGQTLTAPGTTKLLGVQRIQAIYNDRLYFTDLAKTNLWYSELTSISNTTTHRLLTPTNQAIDGVEWMISAAAPSFPYQQQICRSTGGLIGVNHQGYATGFTTSPAGTHMTLFKGRIFMVNSLGTDSADSKLYYSEGEDYGNWPANNFDYIGLSQGDYLVATIVFNDSLVIFKSRSTWVLTADGDPDQWTYRSLHPSIGCCARGSLHVIGGMIYFMGNDGVYRTDGTSFDKISEPIDRSVNYSTSNPSSVLLRNAYYFNDRYFVQDTTGASGVFVFDLVHEAWSRWNFFGGVVITGAIPYNDVQTPYFYFGDANSNKIWRMAGVEEFAPTPWTDNGVSYECRWKSKRLVWDEPTTIKRNYMFAIDVGHSYNSSADPRVVITHKVDSNNTVPPATSTVILQTFTTPGPADLATQTRKELKLPGAGYSRAIETEILYDEPTAFEIYSVSWLNQTKDTVHESK